MGGSRSTLGRTTLIGRLATLLGVSDSPLCACVSLLCLAAVGGVVAWRGAPLYWVSTLLVAAFLGGIPYVIQRLASMLEQMRGSLASAIVHDQNVEASAWLAREERKIVDVTEPGHAIAIVVFAVASTAAYLRLGPPFGNSISNSLSVLLVVLVGIVVGHGTWVLFASLRFFRRLGDRPFALPPLDLGQRQAYYLTQYAFVVSLVVLAGYVWLAASVALDPWPSSPVITGVLGFFAVYPFAAFLWSVFHIHRIQHAIKERQLAIVTADLTDAYAAFKADATPESSERLAAMRSVYELVRGSTDWPLSIQTVATFVLTATTAGIQLLAPRVR